MYKLICYIDHLCFGGAQRVMTNLANAFQNHGYQVLMLNNRKMPLEQEQYEVNKDVERLYLEEITPSVFFSKNLKRLIAIRKICLTEKPDVILSFLGHCNLRMLLATCGLSLKKMVSVRCPPEIEYCGWLRQILAKLTFQLADGVVFQMENVKNWFPKKIQEKSCVIQNPVHAQFFNVIRSPRPAGIVTFGRLEQQKNYRLLLQAFSIISDQFPLEHLAIYGDGTLKSELAEECRFLNLEGKVHFEGMTTKVSTILGSAKMFVLSSDFEGMPNALMEALAAGVPCISTDCPCGGPKKLIKDGENGLLVPCNDADRLADAISILLKDDALRIAIGLEGKQSMIPYNVDNLFQKWESFLFEE